MNRFIASKVVCCDPVPSSPEACVRLSGTLPLKIAPSGPVPPLPLKAASSAVATARWLMLRPPSWPSAEVSVS
jgi:hypothetical protein